MLSQNEHLLQQTRDKRRELAEQAKAIVDKAREENRERTQDEETEVAHLRGKALSLEEDEKTYEGQVEVDKDILRMTGDAKEAEQNGNGVIVHDPKSVAVLENTKSIGQIFVESDEFKAIQNPSGRPQQFSSKAVEISTKGTLLTGVNSPGSGSGGGLMPVPQVAPGVVEKLFQRNVFSNLLSTGQATGNTIRYIVEGTATSGVAGVLEGGLKPESTLGLSVLDEPVKKLATILPVSEEMLEDAAQIEAYVNSRLSVFVQNEEDLELIRGAGAGAGVQGIIGRSGVNIYAGGTAAGNKAEQVFKAINGVRGSAFTEPEWVVLNPTDYQDLRLLKDANNQYFGGGPWMGQYGINGQVASGIQVTGGPEALWGKQIYVTATVGAGTALAGNSRDAIVFRKGGIRLDASNSHNDYFQRNLVALRAEERLALAVFRPASFVEIRLA